MEIIKSKDNKFLKHSKKLKIRKSRQENNEYMIEGLRFVEEAVLSDVKINYCLCSESLHGDKANSIIKMMEAKDVKVFIVEDKLIQDICETKSPQGIVAVVEGKKYSFGSILKDSGFIIIIDRIQDPGNLGTIIRTADAAGVDGIIISEGTVDPYSSKVLRSTMGSIFHLPIINSEHMVKTIEDLKNKGYIVYASSLEGSSKYYENSYLNKTAIVIGNEANGIDETIIMKADRLIKIPMPGKAESLNAGIAAGIMMFEVVKQRSKC